MKKLGFISLFVCLGLLVGCNGEEQNTSEKKESETKNEVVVPKEDESVSKEQEESKEDTSNQEEVSAAELTLYIVDINKETPEFIQKKLSLLEGEKVNSVLIVNEVIKSLGQPIQVDSVTEEGDGVIVSFKKDSPPVVGVGTAGEIEILDSIAKSLIENLEGVNKVFYRSEGGIFETGHTILELDEPYEISTK